MSAVPICFAYCYAKLYIFLPSGFLAGIFFATVVPFRPCEVTILGGTSLYWEEGGGRARPISENLKVGFAAFEGWRQLILLTRCGAAPEEGRLRFFSARYLVLTFGTPLQVVLADGFGSIFTTKYCLRGV
jgi:hypothetical protein